MVGVAPGGAVAVWAHGRRTKEVFFGKADKIEMDPKQAFGLPFKTLSPEEYVQKSIENVLTPEQLKSLEEDGVPFGLWSRYRNLYRWAPVVSSVYRPSNFRTIYLNGEDEHDMLSKTEPSLRPVPSRLFLHAAIGDRRLVYIVRFDEYEVMEAYEHLGKDDQLVYLEITPKLPRSQTRVRLYNEEESFELKKTHIKD